MVYTKSEKNEKPRKKREQKYGDHKDPDNPHVKLIPYLEFFLDNYSKSSVRRVYLQLVPLALYCQQFNKNILEAKGPDILRYFKNIIDKKPISKQSKRTIRYFISAYYNYVKNYKEQMEEERFHYPVPSVKIWDFSLGKKISLVERDMGQTLPTMEIVEKMLYHIYFTKPKWLFIVTSMIVYGAPRVSEIAHLELKNLDLKNRWFITEVKSSKKAKRDGIYFFPAFFQPELKKHVSLLKEGEKWLFPCNKNNHVSSRTIQNNLQDVKQALDIKASINPHIFRDFLNTKRFERGCNEKFLYFLLNQTYKGVNSASYLKKYKDLVVLRDIYDKYNPFDKLIKPKPRL